MQTFLPFEDFRESAEILDAKRLGKQRVETLQILNALADPKYGWQQHPAVKMWRGHGLFLIRYGVAICDSWKLYGYKDTCKDKILSRLSIFRDQNVRPVWLGNEEFHRSHQSNLIRKDLYYKTLWPDVPDNLPYVWPGE
jgi:hypothetical protein